MPAPDQDLLVSAAYLHDIGYAPALFGTGFHPVDGARYLIRLGAPHGLAALVAHHSEARLMAEAAGAASALSEFAREDGPVLDALTYADMTAGPSGSAVSVAERLEDIAARHRHDQPAAVAARATRVPHILAAVDRTRARMPMSQRTLGQTISRIRNRRNIRCPAPDPSTADPQHTARPSA